MSVVMKIVATSRICRVCRTEILQDGHTGGEVHSNVTYDAACARIRAGRTEMETVAAALRSVDQCGSLRDFKRDLNEED